MRFIFLLALAAPALLAEHWSVQYFYDQQDSKLEIVDLAFPTAQHGIAVGWTGDPRKDKDVKPVSLLTDDGGAHWTMQPLKDEPRSLFFLNDSQAWMVTESDIWYSDEGGLNWRKISKQPRPDPKLRRRIPDGLILRVWFLNDKHGFAVGYAKTVLETKDGGRTWTAVAGAEKAPGAPQDTAYTRVVFEGSSGLILGTRTPEYSPIDAVRGRGPGIYPAWMDPERATKGQSVPGSTVLLATTDEGATWHDSSSPVVGSLSTFRLSGSLALDVFSLPASSAYPSDVYKIDMKNAKTERVFQQKDRRVFDALLFPGPSAILAAIEPPGRLNTVPIPGKVKMLESKDLKQWTEMDVDYRAVATTLALAGPDPNHLWVATDTGMILHLEK